VKTVELIYQVSSEGPWTVSRR